MQDEITARDGRPIIQGTPFKTRVSVDRRLCQWLYAGITLTQCFSASWIKSNVESTAVIGRSVGGSKQVYVGLGIEPLLVCFLF